VIEKSAIGIEIESVVANATTYAVVLKNEAPSSWTEGSAALYPNVGMDIEWNAWSAGKPNIMKQVSRALIMVDNIEGNNSATEIVATFRSNLDDEREEVTIDSSVSLWGSSPWGAFPWGGSGGGYGFMTYVPRNKQYCAFITAGLKHRSAREKVSVVGCGFVFRFISERVSK
jgi:hypothetical protein